VECINAYSHVEHSVGLCSQTETVSVDKTVSSFVQKTMRCLILVGEMRNECKINSISDEFMTDFLVNTNPE
jgi:hypothetical protein